MDVTLSVISYWPNSVRFPKSKEVKANEVKTTTLLCMYLPLSALILRPEPDHLSAPRT